MADQASFTVLRTRDDCAMLLAHLERARTIVQRICQRLLAMTGGTGPGVHTLLDSYEFPNGYTVQDVIDLYFALGGLPGSIVDDDTRDKLFAIIAAIQ